MSSEFPLDDAVDAYTRSEGFANRREPAFARFEKRGVAFLLKHYGLKDIQTSLVRGVAETTGRHRLTFHAFHDRYNSFPVWLVIRPVPFAHDMTIDKLANPKRHASLALFRAYNRFQDLVPGSWTEEDQPVGVVFEWLNSGAKGSLWIVHDDASARDAAISVANEEGRRLGIQPFSYFLDRLGWSP
jgi:hypothetical protein